MIRLGIIGTGIIAHAHAQAAACDTGAVIAAVSNRTAEKAAAFAKKFSIDERHVYRDYREMLDSVDLDGVIICLAHHLHLDACRAAAEHGTAVLLEKPMAHTAEACRLVNQAVRKSGIPLMIGHTQGYHPYYRTVKAAIDAGMIGTPVLVKDGITYNYFWEGRPGWFYDQNASGGGILMNYGVHTFDRICFLTGAKVQKVFAHVDWLMKDIPVDSSYQVMGMMEHGISMTMTCSGYSGPFTNRTDVIGTEGILTAVVRGNGVEGEGAWFGNTFGDFRRLACENEDPYRLQLLDFIRLVRGEIPSPIPGEYGEVMVGLVEASYRSHASGEAVVIDH